VSNCESIEANSQYSPNPGGKVTHRPYPSVCQLPSAITKANLLKFHKINYNCLTTADEWQKKKQAAGSNYMSTITLFKKYITTASKTHKRSSKKVKVAHTRLPSVGFRSWSRFLAVSLQVKRIINQTVSCHYFLPGLQLPPATLKRAATKFAAWWTETQWMWTVCLRLLPNSAATAIWTWALLRLSSAR